MAFDSQGLLGPEGLLAQALSNYEYRPQQVEMADHIYEALRNETHGIIEAGTGIGKSLAYLLPLIYYTVEENKRAVVATHTIALQEQLFQKDIPFLREHLPFDFAAEVFKGRRNYLCLRRWEEFVRSGDKRLKELDLEALNLWAQTTESGDLSEAPLYIPPQVQLAICCEKESCPEELCSHFSGCFYWNLRHRLSKAQLIITNQAMLLADLRARGRVLPNYHSVIVDEAHNLEEVATGAFGYELKQSGFLAYYRIGSQLENTLRDMVPEYVISDLRLLLDQLLKEATQYFREIKPLITGYTLLLTEDNRAHFGQTSLPKHLEDLSALLKECDLEENETSGLLTQFVDFTAELKTTLDLILSGTDPSYVYWAEIQNGAPAVIAAPIQIDDFLQNTLFEHTPAVILTSATLSTNRSFDYIRGRLGFSEAEELILGSPFAYERQALLCVPAGAKNPKHPHYPQQAAYSILHTAAAAQGGVLVLFTSYSLMDQVAKLITPKLNEVGYTLFKQGDGPRLGLIQDFEKEPRSLLFGTNSFWEGIDIPGSALKAVVITRLPFAVPDRPITAARLAAVERSGRNPFFEYSVPQAILRLKQGFGRLIRTSQDLGAVVILDQRLLQASYGSQFLASLPPARFSRDLDDLRRLLGN